MASPLNLQALRAFDAEFDTSYEDAAAQQRGAFLKAFPLSSLNGITLDQYVIGKRQPTFCAFVEPLTGLWANILGATSFKFGIYYGRTKQDAAVRYRFVESKFGHTKYEAFASVKASLLKLVRDGKAMRFQEIDENSLSQMFKAKILSLYFPDKFLNVCSKEHIADLSSKLGIVETWTSEQQHLLLQLKLSEPTTKLWSNPKFMTFLYNTYVRPEDQRHVRKARPKKPPKINIEELLENRKRVGKKSEEFALRWEKERLIGLGFRDLVKLIDDRRDAPAYGYDFLSHSSPNEQRYIEVKTAGRNFSGDGFRFYLSQHEYETSTKADHKDRYYFYLVFYEDGEPVRLEEWSAFEMYRDGVLGENGFIVQFCVDEIE